MTDPIPPAPSPKAQGLFRRAFHASSDILSLSRLDDGQIVDVNETFLRVTGWSREEVLGRTALDIGLWVDPDQLGAGREAVLERGSIGGLHALARTRSGQIRHAELSAQLIDLDGEPHILTTARDITEQRRLEDDLRHSVELLRRADAERQHLLAQLVSAEEEERERIAADIHDDFIQEMTEVGIKLSLLKRRIADPEVADGVREVEEELRGSVTRLRRMIFDLHPLVLERSGLHLALKQFLQRAEQENGLGYSLEISLGAEPDPHTRVIVYRIALEALRNVLKHAGAAHVDTRISEGDGGIQVRIRDDGSGFVMREPADWAHGHLGIPSMRQRAELAGGWWRIASSPGSGTTVEFWIPSRGAEAASG